jgi:hypothetical protein
MFQGSVYAGKTISVPTAKLISFHVTEMVVVPALKECSALMMDREAICVTVQLACRNVKLNAIPIHVCINPHVLLFRMGSSVSVLVDQGKSAIVNTTTVIHTLVKMVEHAWISWEGMSVSVLWDGLETDVNLTLMTVSLLHVRMVEHVL